MFNKHIILFLLVLSSFLFVLEVNVGFAVSANQIDLEEKPTLLPSNPVYFIKDFWRGTRLLFAADPIKRAELELRFMEEKLIEVQRLIELTNNERAIEKALRTYQSAQTKLKDRVLELKKISNDSDIEKLFEKIADKAIQHKWVLDKIFEKLEKLAQNEEDEINSWNQKRLLELKANIETALFLFFELDTLN